MVGSLRFIESVDKDGVKLNAAEVDCSDEVDGGAVFLCGWHALVDGVLVAELVKVRVIHNISGDEEVGEVGRESGVYSVFAMWILWWYETR